MNESTSAQKYKFKRYKRAKNTREYALLFADSNAMLDFVCSMQTSGITESVLYTKCGTYQLIVSGDKKLENLKCATFSDKHHINEIKQKNRLVCEKNAIKKIKKSF